LVKIGEDIKTLEEFAKELNEHLLNALEDNQSSLKFTITKEIMWRHFHSMMQRTKNFVE